MKQLLYKLMSKFCDRLGKACLGMACSYQMGMSPMEINLFLGGIFPEQEEARSTAGLACLKDVE